MENSRLCGQDGETNIFLRSRGFVTFFKSEIRLRRKKSRLKDVEKCSKNESTRLLKFHFSARPISFERPSANLVSETLFKLYNNKGTENNGQEHIPFIPRLCTAIGASKAIKTKTRTFIFFPLFSVRSLQSYSSCNKWILWTRDGIVSIIYPSAAGLL